MATQVQDRPQPTNAAGPAVDTGIRGIHHLVFNTDDMKKTLDFYVGILGMRLVHGLKTELRDHDKILYRGNLWHDKCRHYFLDMGSDSLLAFFELPEEGRVADSNAVGAMQHCAFTTTPSRYHELRQRLVDNDVEIIEDDVQGPTSSFYFRDPHGIRLEVSTALDRPEDDGVIASCHVPEKMMRDELLTLCDDEKWVEQMMATVPEK